MSGIDHLILTKNHGLIWDYGWMDNPTPTPWSPAPTEKLIGELKVIKSDSYSVIWDTISSSLNSKQVSFYTGYNKDSIFHYKTFKKWASQPLLSCEYALMLDVLKTA